MPLPGSVDRDGRGGAGGGQWPAVGPRRPPSSRSHRGGLGGGHGVAWRAGRRAATTPALSGAHFHAFCRSTGLAPGGPRALRPADDQAWRWVGGHRPGRRPAAQLRARGDHGSISVRAPPGSANPGSAARRRDRQGLVAGVRGATWPAPHILSWTGIAARAAAPGGRNCCGIRPRRGRRPCPRERLAGPAAGTVCAHGLPSAPWQWGVGRSSQALRFSSSSRSARQTLARCSLHLGDLGRQPSSSTSRSGSNWSPARPGAVTSRSSWVGTSPMATDAVDLTPRASPDELAVLASSEPVDPEELGQLVGVGGSPIVEPVVDVVADVVAP